MALERRLVYSFDNLVWAITGMDSETVGTSTTSLMVPQTRELQIQTLMDRFTNRRVPSYFSAVDEPCSMDDFNFTKVKSSEELFQISFQNLDDCFGLIVANASPFMIGHSLIVPNPGELLNQSPLRLALQTILLSADACLCLGFNSLLAHASVNHLHFHLWYSTHRLFASICPTRKKPSLPFYDELDSHPVDNFVLEFSTLEEFQVLFERFWVLVERCQEMKIAHNLFATRNITGALRVVLWPRRSVHGAKTCHRRPTSRDQCAPNVAVTELAGMFVVPDEMHARPLSLPGGLHEIYVGERLDRREIEQLEALLASSAI
ncbi:GDP-D-glucose phosphorylase 1 [Taenia crassiceps]|uniref:GDP-D-glucose phosphorylase 1 n=1 Tax=Taenia crassiceps TaxID=6207 RepID=A0ABR4QKR9_9CEST